MAWVFEDKFNSDTKSTGDLNGQDGWSGGILFDVVNSNTFEGNQAVEGISANQIIVVTFTGVSVGTVYFSMRKDTQFRDASITFRHSGGNYVLFGFNTANLQVTDAGGVQNLDTNFTTSQYYTFEFNIISTSSFTFRYHDGTSYTSLFTGRTPTNTGAVTDIRLNMGSANSPATGAAYWDNISLTNPFAAGPANLKTWNTVLTASVKTNDTVAIENVKTINTVT